VDTGQDGAAGLTLKLDATAVEDKPQKVGDREYEHGWMLFGEAAAGTLSLVLWSILLQAD
jgi:hypothetical protein